jgi:hypothetical protein
MFVRCNSNTFSVSEMLSLVKINEELLERKVAAPV